MFIHVNCVYGWAENQVRGGSFTRNSPTRLSPNTTTPAPPHHLPHLPTPLPADVKSLASGEGLIWYLCLKAKVGPRQPLTIIFVLCTIIAEPNPVGSVRSSERPDPNPALSQRVLDVHEIMRK
jgi:hypothetical protein